MKVHAPIAFIPQEAIRLSNNEARQLQRVTRALALFLSDYPEVERELGRFASACGRTRVALCAAAGRRWFRVAMVLAVSRKFGGERKRCGGVRGRLLRCFRVGGQLAQCAVLRV